MAAASVAAEAQQLLGFGTNVESIFRMNLFAERQLQAKGSNVLAGFLISGDREDIRRRASTKSRRRGKCI
ncbi:hypothetical protein ZHAS_00015668 [Anopheles sinensis]|uniref:Uncharacterized protein n=1 Tax=Anopheles sinensis TaxID=74873 RepID=A0A084WB25_ANOSI|nr:hypothetical protein ZHAS_00015668 [Anopheles sinensis]